MLKAGRAHANAEMELWRASERAYAERRRRELRAEWFSYYSRLAGALRAQAEEFERRAESLCESQGEGVR